MLEDFELQHPEPFSPRAMDFPMKALLKTEQPHDFALAVFEGQGNKTPLVLEPNMLSFNSGTQKTLFMEHAMITLNSEQKDLVYQPQIMR